MTQEYWTGLDWTGLDWTGLDWAGLDALDRTGPNRSGLEDCRQSSLGVCFFPGKKPPEASPCRTEGCFLHIPSPYF